MEFNEFIKQARTNQNLTQNEVAQKLGYRSAQFVANWESGASFPPIATIKTLAQIYKIDAIEVFERILEIELARLELDKRNQFVESKG